MVSQSRSPVNLCPPAVFVADSTNVFMSSWFENRTNIGSCVPEEPIVVSVPKVIKCLSGIETKAKELFVGAPVIAVALFVTPLDVSHWYIPPLTS